MKPQVRLNKVKVVVSVLHQPPRIGGNGGIVPCILVDVIG